MGAEGHWSAKYAYEYPVAGVTYVVPVQSHIARAASCRSTRAPRRLAGCLGVLWHENARGCSSAERPGSGGVPIRPVAIAGSSSRVVPRRETARQAASLSPSVTRSTHDVELRATAATLTPEYVAKAVRILSPRIAHGDVEAALTARRLARPHLHDPAEHHNPWSRIRPWRSERRRQWQRAARTVYDHSQGCPGDETTSAIAFGLAPEACASSRHVGGFGPGVYPPVCHPPPSWPARPGPRRSSRRRGNRCSGRWIPLRRHYNIPSGRRTTAAHGDAHECGAD